MKKSLRNEMQLPPAVQNINYEEMEKHFCSCCLEYAILWHYPVAASFTEKITM